MNGEKIGSAVASLWRDNGVLEPSNLAYRHPAVRLSPVSASRLFSSLFHSPSSILAFLPPPPPPARRARAGRLLPAATPACAYVSHAGNYTIVPNFCQAPFGGKLGIVKTVPPSPRSGVTRELRGESECSGAL